LVIAGSDSGGGAGIQADIKTIAAFGGYAATAITAVTAQNTLGVQGVWPVAPEFVVLQIRLVLEDIGADAIKTGMLVDGAMIEAVAGALGEAAAPLVVDPVMVAKGGRALLESAAVGRLRALLIPRAALLTPNVPEAEILAGVVIEDLEGMRRAAEILCRAGARAVLIKGGHLPGEVVHDVLLAGEQEDMFRAPRIVSRAGHGTGCTLASAIAVGLARGGELAGVVREAREFVRAGLEHGLDLGAGHQPLDHGVAGPWGRR
jgi:hydroxymethylpyrimidine/phosphomethylpyrimidine kinase